MLTVLKKISYLCWLLPFTVWAQTGAIRGTIADAVTKQPLPGVTILVSGTTLGAVTDVDGAFSIERIPVGVVSLRVSFIGYNPVTKTDVVVQTSRPTLVSIELEEAVSEAAQVTIQASIFAPKSDAPTSIRTISAEEIRRTPGGQGDISRTLLSLPGVISGADNRNDLLVRGGGPGENAYFLDGIEIPQINHFATQGATGGALGMVNVDFIASTDFYSGGFPARYGDALSSLLIIDNRPGSPDRMAGDFTISAADAGLNLDGPLGNKGNWFFSARRSYLQFLFQAIGLPILPSYWDFQTKLEYNLDKNNRISFIGLGAIDNFEFDVPDDPTFEQEEIVARIFDNDQWNYTNGLTWRHLIKDGFVNVALSRSMNEFRFADKNEQTGDYVFQNTSQEAENRLRIDADKRLSKQLTLGFGGGTTFARAATAFTQKPTPSTPYELNFNTSIKLWKNFAYAQAIAKSADGKLTSTLGLRYDGNSFLKAHELSPRLSAAYTFAPNWTLSASVGVFNQSPEYLTMAVQQNGVYVNQNLPYIKTMHYISGLAWQARPSLRLSVEGFYKDYRNYPVSKASGLSLANLGGDYGFVGAEPVEAIGKGRAYGLELFAQKKMVERFYGLASYAMVWSEFSDKNGTYAPSNWDIRHAFSLTGGYRIGKKWEIGAKWRITSGYPFTPYDLAKSAQEYPITGRGVQDFSRLNTERMPGYQRLDVRVDRRFFFSKWNGVVYLDIQNVYNHQNLFSYTYTQDPAYPDHLRPSEQISFLPNIGFSIEW